MAEQTIEILSGDWCLHSNSRNERRSDPGYELITFVLVEDGKDIAYVKVETLRTESENPHFESPWHFMERFAGWCIGFSLHQSGKGENPSLTKIHDRVSQYGLPYHERQEGGEFSVEQMQERLQRVFEDQEIKRKMSFWRKRMNFWFVSYSRVLQEEDKRKGYATKLYEFAAQWLASNRGAALHGSTCQTGEAQGLWKSLKSHPQHGETEMLQDWGKDSDLTTYPKLDYRKKGLG